MRTLILLSLLLASCTSEIVEPQLQSCGGPCTVPEDCIPTYDACLPATCVSGKCAILVYDNAPCPLDGGGTGACNAGACE